MNRALITNRRLAAATGLCLAAVILASAPGRSTRMTITQAAAESPQNHSYVGMWVTADGHIRHELLPNGRYDEARGSRESAYRGRYKVTGTYIEYWDDTGFTADGTFVDANTLHHAGMILRRRP